MNVIVFTKQRGSSRQYDLTAPKALLTLGIGAVALAAMVFGTGVFAGHRFLQVDPDQRVVELRGQVEDQQVRIAELQREFSEHREALAVRVGRMQAHVIRLDALGRRLTQMAELADGEFNFDSPPPQGGPELLVQERDDSGGSFIVSLDDLTLRLDDRDRQLQVLEDLLLDRNLQQQVLPEGRPVKSGWMSSFFGARRDPFTGRRARHDGVDFAGKAGAQVVAVAAGVVTWSGDRHGYGNLVEINHGNGLTTRYAHNQANAVAVGDKVEKGQVVALMGSTGRATGPNLHFEVLQDGRPVDPIKYIKAQN